MSKLARVLGFIFFQLSFIGSIIVVLAFIEVLGGGIIVLLALFFKPQFYQIKAIGLSDSERQAWRTQGIEAEAKTFARFIQDQINARENTNLNQMSTNESIPQVPPIPAMPMTVKKDFRFCGECGAKNLGTDKFCTSCGQSLH